MTIPGFQDLMLPILQQVQDRQEHNIRTIINDTAEHFKLTDAERQMLNAKSKQYKFDNRIRWALYYLKKAGLLDSVGYGVFCITERGTQVLKTPPTRISLSFLKQFPELSSTTTPLENEASLESEDELEPPPEVIEEEESWQTDRSLVERLQGAVVPNTAPPFDEAALDRLIARFQDRIGSFTSQEYLQQERNYKLEASSKLQRLLDKEKLSSLIREGKHEEAKTLIKQAAYGNNLLNQYDIRPMLDAAPAPLAHTLYEVLYGTQDFSQRFDDWVKLLLSVQSKSVKPSVWPVATYYLMLYDPENHICVKSTPFNNLLKNLNSPLKWKVEPTAIIYAQWQELARTLLEKLAPLGARDMLDVQSFIWVVREEFEPDESPDLASQNFAQWQVSVEGVADQRVRTLVREYPVWLSQNLGSQVTFRPLENHWFSLFIKGERRLKGRFNQTDGLYLWLENPGQEIVDLLQQNLSKPDSLKVRDRKNAPGYRFIVYSPEDYSLLQEITERLAKEVIIVTPDPNEWPQQLDGPTFVLMHQRDSQNQQYGQSYSFVLRKHGDRLALYQALEALKAGGPPIYVILYRPGNTPLVGPRKAFTAWARVTDSEAKIDAQGIAYQVLRLEQHEFPVPLYLKGNGAGLRERLDWLADLSKTFWQRPIRQIALADFQAIIEEAQKTARGMQPEDAAYAVLLEAGGGPLPVTEIAQRAISAKLLPGLPTSKALTDVLYQDDRFANPGQDKWMLADQDFEPALPPVWPNLREYWNFVALSLQSDQVYSRTELLEAARQYDSTFNPAVSAHELAISLGQLRLVRYNETQNGYQVAPYISFNDADTMEAPLLRLMALGLLVASEDLYSLPARLILPRLEAATSPQDPATFAPELGVENHKLLEWYAEAGLVEVLPSGEWQLASDGLDVLSGSESAVIAYNELLQALQQAPAPTQEEFGPLAHVSNLPDRLNELGQRLLIEDEVIKRIYRSLVAGRHIILSGPPGTGKTRLAELLPELLWSETRTLLQPSTDPDGDLVKTKKEEWHGYKTIVVTATDDWSVRDVVGGISPRLDGVSKNLTYDIRYGALTQAVLQNYAHTDGGKRLPVDRQHPQRQEYIDKSGWRYRGVWLVIDEFNRAHIDTAFGSLLTTLSGGPRAALLVPSREQDSDEIPMPADFRIIGTLNSFDRHFLNQISEALKRRFDFIDVLPPRPQLAESEQSIAINNALKRLNENRFQEISCSEVGKARYYKWKGVLEVQPAGDNSQRPQVRFPLAHAEAQSALSSFWRLFQAIRVFRKLGTAQAEAVYTNLFTGVLVGLDWPTALDVALADSLADQLQVLTPDEQLIIETFLLHAGESNLFVSKVNEQLKHVQRLRRPALVQALREADLMHNGKSDIDPQEIQHPTEVHLKRIFILGEGLALRPVSLFQQRLRDLNGERGL